jgi:hypothetical protein
MAGLISTQHETTRVLKCEVERSPLYYGGKVRSRSLPGHNIMFLSISSGVPIQVGCASCRRTMLDPQYQHHRPQYTLPKPFPPNSNQLLNHFKTIHLAIEQSAPSPSSAHHTHLFAGLTPTLSSSILLSLPTTTWLRVILPAEMHPSAVRSAFSRSASRG